MVNGTKKRLSDKDSLKVNEHLKSLFSSANGDRTKFRELVEKDEYFLKLNCKWHECDQRARRYGIYKKTNRFSARFWSINGEKDHPGDMKKLRERLADTTTSFEDVLKEFAHLGINSENQLRVYARDKKISIRKGGQKSENQNVYQKRLNELVQDGTFSRRGLSDFRKVLVQDFPNRAKHITNRLLLRQIERVIWNEATLKDLREAVKHGVVETFIESNSHIPIRLVQRQVKRERGVISADQHIDQATLLKGIGRLSVEGTTKKDERFVFPDSSLSKPFTIEVKKTARWTCQFFNGINFGMLYNPLIKHNPLRLAFSYAEDNMPDSVFIVNLTNLEFRKAVGSELHILKAFVSGHNVNPNLLEPVYREEAERILRDSPDDEAVYETAAELVLNLMSGLRKVSNKPINEDDENSPRIPEFNGNVYIVFGYNEESLIANVAYWELKYISDIKIKVFRTQHNLVGRAIKQIQKSLEEWRRKKEFSGHWSSSSIDGNEESAGERENEMITQLQQLQNKDRQIEDAIRRIRVTLTSQSDRRRFTKRLRSIVVKKIEEAIPNSRVIGQGTVNIKIGEKIIRVEIPRHMRMSEGILDSYVKNYGALSRRQLVPDTVIICHPYSLNYRMAVREINVLDKRCEAKIFTAPILVDGDFLREELKDSVRSAHKLANVVFNTNFAPGILQVNCVNGILNADRIGLEVLMKKSDIKPNGRTKKNGYVDRIWLMVMTDPHFGASDREEVWSKATGGSFGVADAVIQMMRDAGLCQNGKVPVHMTTTNDDMVNAHHFENHKQPDPRAISYQELEKISNDMVSGGKSAEDMRKFFLEQDRLRGTYWLQNQIEQVKNRHIKANLDFFEGVLQRSVKSGLIINPVSQIHRVIKDARDLGFINFGTGNHMESEINRSITEGFIYRDYLRALLYGRLQGKVSEETINRAVVAPLEGNQYFAWGYVGMPDEYQWAIEFRSDPPRLSSWADVLKATVGNDALRGDYGLFMTGHKTVKIYGDKHFFATVDTEDVFYHMCASGTHTNLYGHRGFPPNNTGISFVGLPIGGPSAGPILVRPIHIQHIVRYFEKPFDFDWEEFLPDPV